MNDAVVNILTKISSDFGLLAEGLAQHSQELEDRLARLENLTNKNKVALRNIANTILNDLEN